MIQGALPAHLQAGAAPDSGSVAILAQAVSVQVTVDPTGQCKRKLAKVPGENSLAAC